jgi:hypothetical protein
LVHLRGHGEHNHALLARRRPVIAKFMLLVKLDANDSMLPTPGPSQPIEM